MKVAEAGLRLLCDTCKANVLFQKAENAAAWKRIHLAYCPGHKIREVREG